MARPLLWFLLLLTALASGGLSRPADASTIRLADPRPFVFGVPGSLPASVVVNFSPATPGGDIGLDGSAALFDPDDIGFGPEPDSNLSVALGHGGSIELAFERTVVTDGVLSAGASLAGAELLLFEDDELDGASFFGRLASGALLALGSLDDLIVFDPTAPGFGDGGRDTLIAIDLDGLGLGFVELISVLVVDDAFTLDSDTFELDAIMNRSRGRPTPAITPEPGTLALVGIGLGGLWARRRTAGASREKFPAATRSAPASG
jgi:hypothetical protein